MARNDPQLNFRIPIELRDRLEAAAKENKRSLTGELIERLQASFERPAGNPKTEEMVEILDRLSQKQLLLIDLTMQGQAVSDRIQQAGGAEKATPQDLDLRDSLREQYLDTRSEIATLQKALKILSVPFG